MADEGDEPPFPNLSPPEVKELSDEQQDQQNGLKQQAADAIEDGNLDLALGKLTEAVSIGCATAMLYAKRADVLGKLGRPRAVINDCTAALDINPDSAKAFKLRARANAKLEQWEEAHSDFQTALKIDYDEQTEEDSYQAAAKVKEMKAAATAKRVAEEQARYAAEMKANKEAYEAAMKARAGAGGGGGAGGDGGKLVLNSQDEYEKAIKVDQPTVILFSAVW